MAISEADLIHLRRAVELAREALAAGDGPFGSLPVEGPVDELVPEVRALIERAIV